MTYNLSAQAQLTFTSIDEGNGVQESSKLKHLLHIMLVARFNTVYKAQTSEHRESIQTVRPELTNEQAMS